MDKNLSRISHKISDIQLGLVQFKDKKSRIALPVRAAFSQPGGELNCVVIGDAWSKHLLNKDVNFVQRSHDDYLYIKGRVSHDMENDQRVIRINIQKASWFIRKSKGNTSWLQEEYTYESKPSLQIL